MMVYFANVLLMTITHCFNGSISNATLFLTTRCSSPWCYFLCLHLIHVHGGKSISSTR